MRTHTMFATVGVLLLYLGLSVCDVCDTAPGVNGCSIPGNMLSRHNRDVFESECNKHDVCYTCGIYHRVSRRQCDSKFGNNILGSQTCLRNMATRKFCAKVRRVVYLAVRLFGRSHYMTESPDWCSESWVSRCLR